MIRQGSLLQNILMSKSAIGIAFLWGMAEATFFFLVPDVFFSFVSIFCPLLGLVCGVISVLGSVTGGLIMHSLAAAHPSQMLNFLLQVPGIPQGMVVKVAENLHQHGLNALYQAPFSGVPYKIYAVQAGTLGFKLGDFLLVTVPSRLGRIILVSSACAALGALFKDSVTRFPLRWMAAHGIFWVCFYAWYARQIAVNY